MNMSNAKRLKIIVVLVIFSIMLVPITVFALNDCDNLQFRIQNRQNSVTEYNQLYFCGTIEYTDGIEEYVYQDCIITTTIDTYERKCDSCGKVFPQQGVGERKAHSHGDF